MPNPPRKDQGYSLIEVLICLAITALVSTLIFSSLGTQVRQVESVRTVQTRALDETADARLLEAVITRTVEAWPDDSEQKFSGSPQEIRGLSDHGILNTAHKLQPYVLRIEHSSGSSILSLTNKEGEWSFGGLPAGTSLRYLGWDDKWYDHWPPSSDVALTLNDFETNLKNDSLPRMVAVVPDDSANAFTFAFTLRHSGTAASRVQDLTVP